MASAFVIQTSRARLQGVPVPAPFKRRMAMIALMLAMQFMQMLGLVHGIVHAGWPPSAARNAQEKINAALFDYFDADDSAAPVSPPQIAATASPQEQASSALAGADIAHLANAANPGAQRAHHHHSCVEYDAAAGPAGVHIAFFVPPVFPGAAVLALWQACISWDAPCARHFSSRAPPC